MSAHLNSWQLNCCFFLFIFNPLELMIIQSVSTFLGDTLYNCGFYEPFACTSIQPLHSPAGGVEREAMARVDWGCGRHVLPVTATLVLGWGVVGGMPSPIATTPPCPHCTPNSSVEPSSGISMEKSQFHADANQKPGTEDWNQWPGLTERAVQATSDPPVSRKPHRHSPSKPLSGSKSTWTFFFLF